MKRVVWLTDLHLNFLSAEDLAGFLDRVAALGPEVLLLGGDIGEAPDAAPLLAALHDRCQAPLYFVLGNHDFYRGSIAAVRRSASELRRQRPRLEYLTQMSSVDLAPGVGLVGHDGWADGRVGDYERSLVMMNDYRLIAELAGVSKRARLPLLMQLGDEAAAHIRRVLPAAVAKHPFVFLLTHAPPWREACWHEGGHSDDEWAPHFVCQALGEAINDVMADFPSRRLIVLCGHTHSPGETWPRPNIQALTGGARYGQPQIAGVFELPSDAAPAVQEARRLPIENQSPSSAGD